ncbi:MAG: hypothetical protein OXS30_05360 [Chloroflexota bacterium]|nr:hypothetical protein [Chloroflexota bacterium]
MRVSRMVHDRAVPCSRDVYWYYPTMALLPVTIRRRLRGSGFTEDQADALDEASAATAEAARDGMASRAGVDDQFAALRDDIHQLRIDMWRMFGGIAALILAAAGAIMTAIAVWG